MKLATESHALSRPLFAYKPKAHYLHHVVLRLRQASLDRTLAWNPLTYSCANSEDFIGRTSLLSRRVAATKCEFRVLQRYLAGVLQMFEKHPDAS